MRGDLVIDASLPPALWIAELPDTFADLGGVAGMDLTVDGDVLRLRGSTDTVTGRGDAIGLVRAAGVSLSVESDLQVGGQIAGRYS